MAFSQLVENDDENNEFKQFIYVFPNCNISYVILYWYFGKILIVINPKKSETMFRLLKSFKNYFSLHLQLYSNSASIRYRNNSCLSLAVSL